MIGSLKLLVTVVVGFISIVLIAYFCGGWQMAYRFFGGDKTIVNLSSSGQKEYLEKQKAINVKLESLNDFRAVIINGKEISIIAATWDVRRGKWKIDPRSTGSSWYFGSVLNSYAGNRILLVSFDDMKVGSTVEFLARDIANNENSKMEIYKLEKMNFTSYRSLVNKIGSDEYIIVAIPELKQSSQGDYSVFFLKKL